MVIQIEQILELYKLSIIKILKADKNYEGSSFEKFLEGKADKIKTIESIIEKNQKKKEN